jgi:hypothetical protein
VSGLNGSPALLTTSATGAFAAYYAGTQTVALISKVANGAPEVQTVRIPEIQGVPSALAISGDGRSAALVVPVRGRSAIEPSARGSGSQRPYAASSLLRLDWQSGELRQLALVADGSSVVFLPDDNSLVVADPGRSSVFVVRDINGSPARTDLLAGDARLPAPSSVLVSADGQSVLAVGGDGSLAILPLSGSEPVFLKCPCSPESPRRLSGNSALLVSDVRDGVAWMLDWNAAKPRVLFIPPAEANQ